MAELNKPTYSWLAALHLLPTINITTNRVPIDSSTAKLFFSGTKIGEIVSEIFKRKGEEPPQNLASLKKNPQPAGQLYNWNLLNEVLYL